MKLKFYYTNADCLLNTIEELEVLISIENPDVNFSKEFRKYRQKWV